jgi:hypothetical protein
VVRINVSITRTLHTCHLSESHVIFPYKNKQHELTMLSTYFAPTARLLLCGSCTVYSLCLDIYIPVVMYVVNRVLFQHSGTCTFPGVAVFALIQTQSHMCRLKIICVCRDNVIRYTHLS